jgi:UPF0755 protein
VKKIISFILLLILVVGGISAWLVLTNGTAFQESKKSFVIEADKTDKASVVAMLNKKYIIKNGTAFSILASQLGIWDKIKPGKYEVKNGQSLLSIARMLKNAHQAEANLVINKVRTKEELAKLISKSFATDSTEVMAFLQSNDSLKAFGVDTSMVFTLILPDTYTFYWNTPLNKIFQKLNAVKTNFWSKENRKQKAEATGLSQNEIYILASIVEEETNYASDKEKIASVYMNRLNKGMALQACPTIKYAMKDFTLTRIYEKYLFNPSPYNTYRNKGLPPGPICTPNTKTIDLVLNAPKTDYLFFVAKADFSGYHHFSSNFAEHDRYAKEYQKALTEFEKRKQQKEQQP